MPHLDPTYLRYIYDNLIKGSVHPDNASELPDGLIGLYEEAFEEHLPLQQRQKLLKRFAIWALLMKEVSAAFVAEVLGETAEDIQEFISTYSAWFTSPESGKYQLYHERFRVYVLQKVTEKDITELNDKFIAFCETALNTISENEIPEKESYALEFITTHFFISAIQGETECLNKEQAVALKKYAYDQQFWERQIKASKGFEWSKKMLNQMMCWASKFNEDEEIIECALNKVDLYHQEQNDAPRIVQLVSDGDIETALERIEKFGGEDKDGMQRKFILYMLCLMELTILGSKVKEHANNSIEKLLKHLDEHISAYQPDRINWNDFFPSYIIFLIFCELKTLKFNYNFLAKHTALFNKEWIHLNGPYTDLQIKVLYSWIKLREDHINDFENSISNYKSIEYINFEYFTEIKDMALQMINQEKTVEAINFLQEAKEYIDKYFYNDKNRIKSNYTIKPFFGFSKRDKSIMELSMVFAEMKNFEMALECINLIKGENNKDVKFKENALCRLVKAIAMDGNIDKANDLIAHITTKDIKIRAMSEISTVLLNQGLMSAAESYHSKAMELLLTIENMKIENDLLKECILKLFLWNKADDAFWLIENNTVGIHRVKALMVLSVIWLEKGNYFESLKIAENALSLALYSDMQNDKIDALLYIYKSMKNHNDSNFLNRVLEYISKEFNFIRNEDSVSEFESKKAKRFLKYELLDLAISSSERITDSFVRDNIQWDLAKFMIQHNLLKEANKIGDKVNILGVRRSIFIDIMVKYGNQSNIEEAIRIINKRLQITDRIDQTIFKDIFLMNIAVQKAQQGFLKQSEEITINNLPEVSKNSCLKDIAIEMAKKGNLNDIMNVILKINDRKDQLEAFVTIGDTLTNVPDKKNVLQILEKAVINANNLSDLTDKVEYLAKISTCYHRIDEADSSFFLLNQARKSASGIKSGIEGGKRFRSFSKVIIEMVNQRKYDSAIDILCEENFIENSTSLYYCVYELVKNNFIEKAFLLAKRLKRHVKLDFFINIFIDLIKEGNYEMAASFFIYFENSDIQKDTINYNFEMELIKSIFESIKNSDFGILEQFIHDLFLSDKAITSLLNSTKYSGDFVPKLLIKQKKEALSFSFVRYVSLHMKNLEYFKSLGLLMMNEVGISMAIDLAIKYCNDEEYIHVLDGIAQWHENDGISIEGKYAIEFLKPKNSTNSLLLRLLFQLSINQLFFSNLPQEKLDRYNRTINLQWAIDLKKELDQIPN